MYEIYIPGDSGKKYKSIEFQIIQIYQQSLKSIE